MKSPLVIEFVGDCLTVLKSTLLAVAPHEGCALLIGKQKADYLKTDKAMKIHMIWPCCNIWSSNILGLQESHKKQNSVLKEDLSKKNRFAIDPREQLIAQRWARERDLQIIGSAHSHPQGEPIPSVIDLNWNFSPGIIVIIGQYGAIRAWWMSGDKTFLPKEVAIWELK